MNPDEFDEIRYAHEMIARSLDGVRKTVCVSALYGIMSSIIYDIHEEAPSDAIILLKITAESLAELLSNLTSRIN